MAHARRTYANLLQDTLWLPSKDEAPPTPEGIVRRLTQDFEARTQVDTFPDSELLLHTIIWHFTSRSFHRGIFQLLAW